MGHDVTPAVQQMRAALVCCLLAAAACATAVLRSRAGARVAAAAACGARSAAAVEIDIRGGSAAVAFGTARGQGELAPQAAAGGTDNTTRVQVTRAAYTPARALDTAAAARDMAAATHLAFDFLCAPRTPPVCAGPAPTGPFVYATRDGLCATAVPGSAANWLVSARQLAGDGPVWGAPKFDTFLSCAFEIQGAAAARPVSGYCNITRPPALAGR